MPFGIGDRADAASEAAGTAGVFALLRAIIARAVTNIGVLGVLTTAAAETADTTPAMGLLRAIIARLVTAAAAMGALADAASEAVGAASIIALLRAVIARQKGGTVTVYPTAAAGVQITSGSADTWDGAAAELVAASGIATTYRVTSLTLHTPSVAMVGIVRLAYGATPTTFFESGFAFESDAGPCIRMKLAMEGGTIPANARVVAIVKTVTGSETLRAHCGTMATAA